MKIAANALEHLVKRESSQQTWHRSIYNIIDNLRLRAKEIDARERESRNVQDI